MCAFARSELYKNKHNQIQTAFACQLLADLHHLWSVRYYTALQIEFVTENVRKEGSLASIYPEQMDKWKKIKSEFVVTRQFGQMFCYTVLSVEKNMIQTISVH